MTKRIAFVGAGAIGGYIGANLTALGHDVTLIDPWPAHVEAMRANGMHLYGMTEPENRVIRVNAMHITDAQQLAKQRPIDIAFIAVKSYDTVWATRLIRQYLAPGGFVVSSQNCINEERIAGVVGWGRTVGCVVGGGVGVELFEPGHVRRTMTEEPQRRVVPCRRTARPHLAPCRGTGRDAERHRQRARHRQSVGRALDQTLRQRHAQRRLRRDRPRWQRARQPRRDPAHLHQAGRRVQCALVRRWASRWARSARWSRRNWRWHRKAIAVRWKRSRR